MTLDPSSDGDDRGVATLDLPRRRGVATEGLDESLQLSEGRRRWSKASMAALVLLLTALVAAAVVGRYVTPTWVVREASLDVHTDEAGKLFYVYKDAPRYLADVVKYEDSVLHQDQLAAMQAAGKSPAETEQVVRKGDPESGAVYLQLSAAKHWGVWSLLPAVVAIALCLLTKEPLTALLSGVVVGAFILGRFDLTEKVLMPSLASPSAAGILLLYLWLLGGLMGLWSRTGAAQAFAVFMTEHFVRGPRSARFVAWLLGVIFFQGGTVSTVLVGTAVRPITDKERISHEELSYIVDSTASPIACLLAFNAWPGYVQAFMFVPGVAFLASESDRLAFFFKCVPLSFYAIFAVIGTLLLCFDRSPFLGRQMRDAIRRSRETGQLDAPGAKPMSSKELEAANVPAGYRPHVMEFFLPLIVLVAIAIGTFVVTGSPQVRWAFGAALLVAAASAMIRGMSLADVIEGVGHGLKGVVLASVILLLAVTVGTISQETGGGLFLVQLLESRLVYWLLPLVLMVLTMAIAFSTGTSWGTYAVAFPLAMPLAWAIAQSQGLEHTQLFMMLCFAAVMNGSVWGDQCSPISDTTILSAVTCGGDLMDHVRTQLVPATAFATIAAALWTLTALIFV